MVSPPRAPLNRPSGAAGAPGGRRGADTPYDASQAAKFTPPRADPSPLRAGRPLGLL